MAHLKFTVGADSTQLASDLDGMERMGEKFSHKFQHHMSKAFGIGFLAVAATKSIEAIFERPEKIEEMARKFELTSDEVQILEAHLRKTGQTMDDFIEKANKMDMDVHKVVAGFASDEHPSIASEQNLKALRELKEGSKEIGSNWINALINLAGGFVHHVAGFGMPKEKELESPYVGGERINGMAIIPFDATSLGNPIKDAKKTALQKKLDALMGMENYFEDMAHGTGAFAGTKGHWSHPSTTDWQAAGAFTAMPQIFTPETTDERLEDIRQEIKTTNEELRKLREGTGG